MANSPLSSLSTSSSSLYPSSYSSVSPPLLSNLSSPSRSYSHRYSAQDSLETLISRHGHPTPVALSSLRDLTATSSAYNPPSQFSRPTSPISSALDSFEDLSISRSRSRPIPIPRPPPPLYCDDLPVTPLTGRFDKGGYFPHSDRSPTADKGRRKSARKSHGRSGRHTSRPRSPSKMRADSSTYYSSAVSASMSPSGRPVSPQPSRSRAQGSSKSAPSFHLGSLPRFHPAVYQSSSTSHNGQPPSPRQPRQHTYRPSSSSRDAMWQYRELVESVTIPRTPPGPLSPSPTAPRLDPLRSPGPVTPLALEESSGYLVSGAADASQSSLRDNPHGGAAPDLVEKLILREKERARQMGRKTGKGR